MAPTPLPLTRLFAQLQAAGFRLDTRRKLRLWRALHAQGAGFVGKTEELKYLLAPLIATTAAEQERFYQLWDGFLEECKKEAVDPEAGQKQPDPPRPLWKNIVWPTLTVLLLSLAGYWIYQAFFVQAPKEENFFIGIDRSSSMDKLVRDRDTVPLHNWQPVNQIIPAKDSLYWEVKDAASGALDSVYQAGDRWYWQAAGYGADKQVRLYSGNRVADSMTVHIHCADPPDIDTVVWPRGPFILHKKYPFTVKAERGAVVRWVFDGRDTVPGSNIQHEFKQEGQVAVECIVARPKQESDCYETVDTRLEVGSDKPFLQLAELQYDQPRLLRQLAGWVWLLLLLPLLPAAWLLRRWLQKRRQKPAEKTPEELAAEYPIHDIGPYHIPYRPNNHLIGGLAAFFRMAEVLSRREEDERCSFDANASINATIESGGFPSWRERALTSPPDYLVLVTRRDERDQQGRLFERLTSFLKNQDAPVTVFFHDGHFRRFWNPDHPAGLPLHHLAQHYADHQLVLLGDGHGLINPYDTRRPALLAEVAQLLRWRKRLLLTPSPVAAWSYQEALLHQHFLLYPADTEGLLAGFEALEALEEFAPDPFVLWETAQGRSRRDASDRYRRWDSAEAHREFLQHDPEAFRWLCALAVSAQPDYALTLAIGHALGIEPTHDRLLRLSRIPWLSANEPATALRLALLAQCPPDDERLARQAAAAELEAVREQVAGAFAETDWRVHLAIHQFALDPRDEAHKQAIRELRALGLLSGSQEAELDWIVQERADGTGLPAGATQNLTAWLDTPKPKRWWTWEMGAALACVALSALLLAWGVDANHRLAETPAAASAALPVWQAQQRIDDEALRLHNEAVGIGKRLAGIKEYSQWKGNRDSIQVANTLFYQAELLRAQIDGNYNLAFQNQEAFNYNSSAQRLNFYLSDSAAISEVEAALTQKRDTFPRYAGNVTQIQLATDHCEGLCHYYLSNSKQDTIDHVGLAIRFYNNIQTFSNNTYFDSLRTAMPVNLETLLFPDKPEQEPPARVAYALRVLLLDAQTKAPVPNAEISTRSIRPMTSDSRGHAGYVFPGKPFAFVSLRVKAPGYLAWEGGFKPRTDNARDTIWLRPMPPSEQGNNNPIVDRDGDGVQDSDDLCPDTKGLKEYKGCPSADNLIQLYIAQYMGIAIEEMERVGVPASILLGMAILESQSGQSDLASAANNHFGLKCGSNWTGGTYRMTSDDRDAEGNPVETCFRKYQDAAESYRDQSEFLRDPRKTNRYGFLFALKRTDYKAWARGLESAGYASSNTFATALINLIEKYELFKLDTDFIPLPTMLTVAGGTLPLGCTDEQSKDCYSDEKPPHPVTLSGFALSATEVTNEQYAAFLNDYGSTTVKNGPYQGMTMIEEHDWGIRIPIQKGPFRYAPQSGYEKHPVVNVSWYGATEYCRWLSERTGQNYRLPTEAEWEYAARGGQKADPKRMFLYAGSDNLDEVAWYGGNSGGQTHPVGQKKPNILGLYDMSGNVWEWCSDWYGKDYYKTISKGAKNPTGPDSGDNRVNRGGGWNNDPQGCRAAIRLAYGPTSLGSDIGFRLVLQY
ncbi:MAG: SUMF1/EgtB/PvdO family nonheme iron enzyme [Saprospiraceae bacterium]|nr:SUMF1/EgtB/PvdO family nonheme iron enzyme [Saprospiraceae bacterium]